MTRINVVPVEMLSNKHLIAEYKEITRPFNKVIKRVKQKTMKDITIPKSYVLGTGHETFFFDKLEWLYNRYISLKIECERRGFNINVEQFAEICDSLHQQLAHTKYWKQYTPDHEAIYLNMARLAKRSTMEKVLEELSQ